MREHRSKNPDLLFPDTMMDRTRRVMRYVAGFKGDLPRKLDRVTAVVTHRCNYRCVYCNGPHTGYNRDYPEMKKEMLSNDMSYEQFSRLFADWQKVGITHIHFTGGEPTLNRDLPKMFAHAKKGGVLTSITSNGSADWGLYKKLIDNGMTEIRISIDADDSYDYDRIVGVKNYFPKVVKNIKEIASYRDKKHADIFIVLNACIGSINFGKMEKLLKFLIALKPDDIKFLVIAMERKNISANKSKGIVKRMGKLLERELPERFILLKDKISKLFDADSMGLMDKKTISVMKHCYIPATERTVTATHYYPCSIYLRGYGAPIGKISDSFEMQQKKIMNFIKNHDCKQDRICKNICTNCCKIFNNHINEKFGRLEIIDISQIKEFSKKEIEKKKKEITKLRSGKALPRWFVIIKPFGQKNKKEIKDFLRRNDFGIEEELETDLWRTIAAPLYRKDLAYDKIKAALRRDKAYQKVEGDHATVLFIKNGEKLKDIKIKMREEFPAPLFLLKSKKGYELVEPNAFHIPDFNDLIQENAVLRGILKIKNSAKKRPRIYQQKNKK